MKIMDGKSLAKELGISQTTLWRLNRSGVIPRVKGTRYYNLDSVRKALEQEEFNVVKGRELVSAK